MCLRGSPVTFVSNRSTSAAREALVVSGKFKVSLSTLQNWVSERTRAEVGRLAIALVVAVFALVAGVKDQLAKLDVPPGLIAIFVVGYGVDVLRNLINSEKSSA